MSALFRVEPSYPEDGTVNFSHRLTGSRAPDKRGASHGESSVRSSLPVFGAGLIPHPLRVRVNHPQEIELG